MDTSVSLQGINESIARSKFLIATSRSWLDDYYQRKFTSLTCLMCLRTTPNTYALSLSSASVEEFAARYPGEHRQVAFARMTQNDGSGTIQPFIHSRIAQ
jgi:hypothetical protein